MPQMAPMWWTFISSMTFCMLVVMIIITYFSMIKKIKTNSNSQTKIMNWKW